MIQLIPVVGQVWSDYYTGFDATITKVKDGKAWQRGFGFRVRVVPLPYAGPFSYPPAPVGAKPSRHLSCRA